QPAALPASPWFAGRELDRLPPADATRRRGAVPGLRTGMSLSWHEDSSAAETKCQSVEGSSVTPATLCSIAGRASPNHRPARPGKLPVQLRAAGVGEELQGVAALLCQRGRGEVHDEEVLDLRLGFGDDVAERVIDQGCAWEFKGAAVTDLVDGDHVNAVVERPGRLVLEPAGALGGVAGGGTRVGGDIGSEDHFRAAQGEDAAHL